MKGNNQKDDQNKISALIFWGIFIILFLPIIILPPNFQPSDWSRATLFRIILTLLISVLFFGYFYKKDFSFEVPKWKISNYLPFLLLAGFFLTLVLSTFFSEDIRFSIFGSPARAGGVLNSLFFFIFVIFLSIFIKENDWKKLFKVILAIGLLASLLGFIQSFSAFKNIFIHYETAGIPSFFGNSTFLAIFMLFLIFFSFVLFIQEKRKKIYPVKSADKVGGVLPWAKQFNWVKIAYLCFFLTFLFTLLITGSRATYLAVLISFLYLILFYPAKNKKIKIIKITVGALLILTIAFVVYVNISPRLPSFIENNKKLSYFAHNRLSIKLVATDLLDIRLSTWKITLNAIKEKPIFGWGPENFYIGFEKHFNPNFFNLYGQWWVESRWWDRPHNVFLDIAANSGLISVILYCLFWLVLLGRLQKLKKQQNDNNQIYWAHGLQAMFIGYFVVLFFNFDIFSSYFISFFFVGYSFYLISQESEKKIIYPPKTNFFKNKFVYIPLLLLLVLFVWFWNIKPLYSAGKIALANDLANIGKCDKSLTSIDNIWQKSGILNAYAGLQYANIVKKCFSVQNEILYSKKALEALNTSAKIQPKFTATWLLMGSFGNILAATEENPENKNKLLSEARAYLEKARELSPKRQDIISEMEKNYLVSGDYQAMKKMGEDCVKIDPDFGECYWYLGIAEIFSGDQKNGKKHIQESREKSPFAPYWPQLGMAYISQKNYKDAIEPYFLALQYNDARSPNFHAILAVLYKELGDYEKAGVQALDVASLQPENKEAIEFLNQLANLMTDSGNIHNYLSIIYNNLGDTEKARQEYLILKSIYIKDIEKNPKNPDAYLWVATFCRDKLEDYEDSYKYALLAKSFGAKKMDKFIRSLPGNYWERYINNK